MTAALVQNAICESPEGYGGRCFVQNRHPQNGPAAVIAYDTTPYIVQNPRREGWHDVMCRVVWTPLWGHPIVTTGAYLDSNSPNGPVFLACGIEEAAELLGMTYALSDPDHTIAVCELVTVALEKHPYAELVCPEGHLRIELVPVSDANTQRP